MKSIVGFIGRVASLRTLKDEYLEGADDQGRVVVDGVTYDSAEDMRADISDDRLLDDFAVFEGVINAARSIALTSLWEREGGADMTSLIRGLSSGDGPLESGGHSELSDLLDQSRQLSRPLGDWNAAAIEAGWEPDGFGFWYNPETGEGKNEDLAVQDIGVEPVQYPMHQAWAVSDWLADELAAQGEIVAIGFAGMNVWAIHNDKPPQDQPSILIIAAGLDPQEIIARCAGEFDPGAGEGSQEDPAHHFSTTPDSDGAT